jgi:hypothetical protein
MDNDKDQFEISELFMAQADRDRRFFGTIKRETDSDGTSIVRGKIMVNNGFVCAMAACQDVLGERLDEMVLMVLDYDIHKISGHDFIVSSN